MDYSKFGLAPAQGTPPLADFGWRPHFAAQLDPAEVGVARPARVTAVHRNMLALAAPGFEASVPPLPPDDPATVGDWLVLDPNADQVMRRLERFALLKRRAAGSSGETQLIAANVDTLFIVTSCNDDFNIARLERYLSLAFEADVTPIILLTKSDLTDAPDDWRTKAEAVMTGVFAELIDARDPNTAEVLSPWLGRGQTVAFVGSSGVGKSTLVNTLRGTGELSTQGIRQDDAKGRHTTTSRALFALADSAWCVDTPGMRELGMADAADGISTVFADVQALAEQCKFRDCAHETEPGCAVRQAIDEGRLDAARFERWRKLVAEDTHNARTMYERRAADKSLGRMIKDVVKHKNR